MDKISKIDSLKNSVDEMSKLMFDILVDWYSSLNKPLTPWEEMAVGMYRMMIFKARSIFKMSEGVIITPSQKGIITDPSTIYPVLRSMYELTFLFKCIYNSSRNDIELELLYKIWEIKGNNNLIKIPDEELGQEYKDFKQSKIVENDKLKEEVCNLMDRLELSLSVKHDIEKVLNEPNLSLKGYKFEHAKNSDTVTAFKPLPFGDKDMGMELSGVSYIYSHYSAHSHPSYLGVKHFIEMYQSKAEDNFLKEILEYTCLYLVRFMVCFYEYKEPFRQFYNEKASRVNGILKQLK